jgi:hypothetical protein
MAEKIITCNECQGMFDVGHIAPGKDVKCPQCGNSLVVPGDVPIPVSGSRPRTVAVGSSPRMATASGGTRPGTALKRSSPLMRKVGRSRGPGTVAPRSSPRHGVEEGGSSGRQPAVSQNKKAPVLLFVSLGVLVVAGIAMAMMMGKDKKSVGLPKKPESTKGAPLPLPDGPKVSVAFKPGSDGKVDGWTVDAGLKEEAVAKLRKLYASGGVDVAAYVEIVQTRFETFFPLIADCLRSDEEPIAREAAKIANEMSTKCNTKYGVKIGDRGEFISDVMTINEPDKRKAYFAEMRKAWDAVQEKMKASGVAVSTPPATPTTPATTPAAGGTDPAPATPAAAPASPVSNSGTVEALRRGGVDREEAMQKMKANPGNYIRELIRHLPTDDPTVGKAVANALNELTGANIEVPAGEYKGADMKKLWDDWVAKNSDKVK